MEFSMAEGQRWQSGAATDESESGDSGLESTAVAGAGQSSSSTPEWLATGSGIGTGGVSYPSVAVRRFCALFDDDIDPVRREAEARGVELDAVAKAYFVVTTGELPLVSRAQLIDCLGMGHVVADAAAEVLLKTTDIWRTKGGNYRVWYVYASTFMAELCERRRISLQKYVMMDPILSEFQADVVTWFEERNTPWMDTEKRLTDIKADYTHRVQQEFYRSRPFDRADWSDHVASKYVRTAQDAVMAGHALNY